MKKYSVFSVFCYHLLNVKQIISLSLSLWSGVKKFLTLKSTVHSKKRFKVCLPTMTIGGGVEDTRLEAKDTKKFRGQGQTLLRPRTEMLEAKAKDQGHRHKCSPKKKVLKKFFQAISKKRSSKKLFFLGDFHLKKTKKGLRKFSTRFLPLSNKILTVQKIVLSSSRGQGNFRGLEASRPRQRTLNLSSRPKPSCRTSPLMTTQLQHLCIRSFVLQYL